MTIRVGIMGYGNLGRGVELALRHNPDMELKAVFTRRNPDSVRLMTEGVQVVEASKAASMADQIDVMILCGGSATDLPEQTPYYAQSLIPTHIFRSILMLLTLPLKRAAR